MGRRPEPSSPTVQGQRRERGVSGAFPAGVGRQHHRQYNPARGGVKLASAQPAGSAQTGAAARRYWYVSLYGDSVTWKTTKPMPSIAWPTSPAT